VLSLLPFDSMVGLGWFTTLVMLEHLQNLVSLGHMTVVELATCRVPEDPVSKCSSRGIYHGAHGVL
jgi:hypothetical protein